MATVMSSILKAASRKPGEPLNILTCPTHERTEVNLAAAGHRFWAWRGKQVKDWNSQYAPLPSNYTLLDPNLGANQIPSDVELDLVFSQNRFGQYQVLREYAKALHLPLLTIEHTLPHPQWSQQQLAQLKGMSGHLNCFISEYSRKAWGWKEEEAIVVHHGVNTKSFAQLGWKKEPFVLSVVNQLRERDWCCGYSIWREVTAGLPIVHLGESPDGWSKPAKDVADLVAHYNRCSVFLDTATHSPVPTVLLEAMACGAVCVSYGNAMVGEVIAHGRNGYIERDTTEMRKRLEDILADPEAYRHVGEAARRTIVERFNLDRFVTDWDAVFRRAASIPYLGEFH